MIGPRDHPVCIHCETPVEFTDGGLMVNRDGVRTIHICPGRIAAMRERSADDAAQKRTGSRFTARSL